MSYSPLATSPDPGALHQPDALLDLLPVALCRWDIPGGIPTSASVEEMCHTLRTAARAGYANPAYLKLVGSRREELVAVLAGLEPPGCGSDQGVLRRFVAAGHRLERFPLRVPGVDRRPRYCQATWLGVIQDGRLVAIWTVLSVGAT